MVLDEDFIKKCIAGQEDLRKVWKPKEGDRVLTRWNSDENKLEIDYYSKDFIIKKASVLLHKNTDVWLPYDEQLQKIADNKLHLGYGDLGWAYYWWLEGDGFCLVECWIDFVFEKRFNKRWNYKTRKWDQI